MNIVPLRPKSRELSESASSAPSLVPGAYRVKLEAFEGPMELLLHVVRENKFSILDIPISKITEQFLEYLELLKEIEVDDAGAFIEMASRLIHYKSRHVLPSNKGEEDEEDDFPIALGRLLLDYRAFQLVGNDFETRMHRMSLRFFRGEGNRGDKQLIGEVRGKERKEVSVKLFDLLASLQTVLRKIPDPNKRVHPIEKVKVEEKMRYIMKTIGTSDKSFPIEEFFTQINKIHKVAIFLALLELMKYHKVLVYQKVPLGPIFVRKDNTPSAASGPSIHDLEKGKEEDGISG